jgi:hypothetical protein
MLTCYTILPDPRLPVGLALSVSERHSSSCLLLYLLIYQCYGGKLLRAITRSLLQFEPSLPPPYQDDATGLPSIQGAP